MAERKPRRTGGSRGKKRDVIDVGDDKHVDKDAAADRDDTDEDGKAEKGDDDEGEGEGDGDDKETSEDELLADAASQIIDVADDGTAQPTGEWAVPEREEKAGTKKRERGGSLVKRDPLQAYMTE